MPHNEKKNTIQLKELIKFYLYKLQNTSSWMQTRLYKIIP